MLFILFFEEKFDDKLHIESKPLPKITKDKLEN